MLHKILMTTLSLLFGCQLFAQQEMSVVDAITDILSGEKEKMSKGCDFLATQRGDSTLRFVATILEGGLYEGQKVSLSRRDKRALSVLTPYLNIKNESADVRVEAYTTLSLTGVAEDIEYLTAAVSSEVDKKAKKEGENALNFMLLRVGNNDQQSAAIEHISESNDMYFSNIILEYILREDVTNSNKASAEKLAKYYEMVIRNNNIYQNIFSGLSLGSILVLVSLGLSIVYGLAGVINMSHGEFLMIGAYTTYCVQQIFAAMLPESMFDLAFFLSIPLSFIVAALFGLVIERLVLRHLYSRPLESMLATLGISLILIQFVRSIFGDITTVKAPAILSGGITFDTGLILPYNRLFIIGLTVVIFIGVYFLFQRTRLGVRIRAVTQNRNMSACVGISTQKIDMITFMIGSGLAGVAGCAITLIGNVVPNMGQNYIVDSFLTVVTGGVGKLAGCAVSGIGIGVLSKFFEAGFEAVYGKVLILLLIIIFLQYRPKGLFADKGRIGDD
ncbi:MAG: urea ABC transporter permease subunit UrtB [Rikenellaceae bacterium]